MSQTLPEPQRAPRFTVPVVVVALAVLVALGAWLRIAYVQQVGLHVDEYVTLWAATRILDGGLPVMPSGMFYGRGLLTSYLAAGTMALGGVNAVAGRLPSVLMGVIGVLTIFALGRREWNVRVGLLAAAALALLPEAIDAAGRVRFYAQFMLWSMLTLWAAYRMTRRPDAGWRLPWLLLIAFTLALFTQEEMILLYPVIALGLLLWNGIGVFRRPPILFALLGCALVMFARYLVERIGVVDSFDSVQSTKAYIGLFFAWQSAWDGFAGIFTDGARLAWTLLAAVAVVAALYALWRKRSRLGELAPFHQATLYFALHLGFVWLVMLTLVGESWHEARFMLFVEPNWLLLGAAGLIAAINLAFRSPAARMAVTVGAMAILVWFMLPSAQDVIAPVTVDYTSALEYVAEERLPADRIASPQPAACAWTMGQPCAYYARGLDFDPYVVRQNGHLVDRWTGALLLDSGDALKGAIRESARLWLVVDRDRLANRYDLGSLETILEQFDMVHEVGSTLVFVADGVRPTPEYTVAQQRDPPLALGPLRLIGWRMTTPAAGEPMRAVLDWMQDGTLREQISTSIQLVAADGRHISQADGPPGEGMILMRDMTSEPIPDFKLMHLPASLAEGWYRLEVVAYTPEGDLLGDPVPIQWFHIGGQDDLSTAPRMRWAKGIELGEMQTLPAELAPATALPVTLTWQSTTQPAADLTVFVHLVGPDGSLAAQHDKIPLDGFFPTTGWTVGTVLTDQYTLQLPEILSPGSYRLVAGWYDAATGERVLTEDGSDGTLLGEWRVP